MSLVWPGTMLFMVFGAIASVLAFFAFSKPSKQNDRRCAPANGSEALLGCGAVPRRGGGGVLGGEREGDCGAGDGVWGISDKAGSRAGSPPGPTSTLRQAHLNGAARSLVVQMCITATVSMWLMCVQPPTPQEAARPARPPPCHRHSRPLCFWLPCNGLALPPASD